MRTTKLRLGTAVLVLAWHNPAMLAKIVSTLDVLSGGRAWLGVGAGDYPDEAQGLGMPYPPTGERFEMLEETVQICLRMWSDEHGDDQPYHGKHFQLERALNSPQLPPQISLAFSRSSTGRAIFGARRSIS